MNSTTSTRRHDIDYLRVFATYLLFVFHVGMVFNPAPFYHIRNQDVSIVFLILCGFISLWHMPLFFVLAGWSAFSSLSLRGGRGFAKERILRLLVPLAAGCILFGPLIKYVELASGFDMSMTGFRVSAALQESFREIIPSKLALAPPFHETLGEFWPTYFTRLGRFTWSHLWFLAYLLTFSLLYLPVFSWLIGHSGERGRGGASGEVRVVGRPAVAFRRLDDAGGNDIGVVGIGAGAGERRRVGDAHGAAACRRSVPVSWVYLPIVPLALVQVILRPHYPGIQNLYSDWANFAYYSTFMTLGFLLACAPPFELAVQREYKRAFALGLASVVALLGAVFGILTYEPVVLALTAVAGWSFIVAMLGFARRCLTRGGSALSYLAEGSLPIYVLHQPAIVLIGYPLVQLDLGIAAKFVLLLVLSVGAAQGFYHLFARHVPILRFAFGMKPSTTRERVSVDARLKPALLAIVVSTLLWSSKADAANPVGLWWADHGSAKVEIEKCDGNKLCGTVVWLRSPFDDHGCELRDSSNSDPELRERPVLGMEILRGLEAPAGDDDDLWTGGTIYDPGSGRTYSCTLEIQSDYLAHLRGYIGIPLLGRTTTWIRVGAESRACSE